MFWLGRLLTQLWGNLLVDRPHRNRIFRLARVAWIGWVGVELGPGILASAVVVALLPAILILLTRPALPWIALAVTLSLSIPLSGILAARALTLWKEILAELRWVTRLA